MGKVLVDDANNKVVQLLIKKPVQSNFKSVQDDVADCNAVKFMEDLQKFIVKVAQIVSEISVSHDFDDGDCKSAIKYLCKKVLKENDLYDDLEKFVSKTDASKIKHAEEKEAVIGAGANMYNAMIYQLASHFDLPSLGNIYITAPIGSSKEKSKKGAEEAEQPKKQDKHADKAEEPKKQDKHAEKAEQSKKQDKHAEEPAQPKKAAPTQAPSHSAKSKASFVDDAVGTLTVEIMRGDGWYEKNLPRKDFFQCLLVINFEGKYELKSSQVVVNSLKVDKCEIQDLVKNKDMVVKRGRNELNIEMDRQGMQNFLANKCCDNINRLPTEVSVTVIATVKSGLTKMKKLPCDVSCVF